MSKFLHLIYLGIFQSKFKQTAKNCDSNGIRTAGWAHCTLKSCFWPELENTEKGTITHFIRFSQEKLKTVFERKRDFCWKYESSLMPECLCVAVMMWSRWFVSGISLGRLSSCLCPPLSHCLYFLSIPYAINLLSHCPICRSFRHTLLYQDDKVSLSAWECKTFDFYLFFFLLVFRQI